MFTVPNSSFSTHASFNNDTMEKHIADKKKRFLKWSPPSADDFSSDLLIRYLAEVVEKSERNVNTRRKRTRAEEYKSILQAARGHMDERPEIKLVWFLHALDQRVTFYNRSIASMCSPAGWIEISSEIDKLQSAQAPVQPARGQRTVLNTSFPAAAGAGQQATPVPSNTRTGGSGRGGRGSGRGGRGGGTSRGGGRGRYPYQSPSLPLASSVQPSTDPPPPEQPAPPPPSSQWIDRPAQQQQWIPAGNWMARKAGYTCGSYDHLWAYCPHAQ